MWSTDRVIGRVQVIAHLGSRREAELVTRATLQSLAGCLGRRVLPLAEDLPGEIGGVVRSHAVEVSEPSGVESFLAGLQRRTRTGRRESEKLARAVLEAIAEAVGPGTAEAIPGMLPAEYRRVLKSPPWSRGPWEPAS